MKKMTKAKSVLLAVIYFVFSAVFFTGVNVSAAEDTALPFRVLSGEEITAEMGAGWNLGNTFDGHTGFTPNETLWQNVKTTKALMKSVHDLGFNTVRIPITWGTMIDDENGYAIDEAWISRVQDVVDYAIEQDMYVIINIHHDGAEQMGWLRIASEDKEALCEKFAGVWKNIAERFKNYDEHLIFEAMNEVKGEAMSLKEENAVIMELNQIFVDTVRATGGNNAKRWLCVCGKYNYIDSLVNANGGFELPKDSMENAIMLSAHCYTPWSFCGSESTDTLTYTLEQLQTSNERELSMLEGFTSQGIPVIIGEYGCINKNNPEERAFFLEGMNELFRKYNLIGIYWDQGWYERGSTPDYSFSIVDRETGEPIEKEVTDAIIRGFFANDSAELEDLVHGTAVTEITDISAEESVELTVGETYHVNTSVQPAGTNDVVLYKTDNASVATAYNGMIRAKGIGETVVTVYSQSGSAEKEIKVKVTAAANAIACTEITTDEDSYNLKVDEYSYLNAKIATEGCEAYLTYSSSDDSVATVSSIGKIVAVGEGDAEITVRSSDGFEKKIAVSVADNEAIAEIILALNVYYNDSHNNYYSNEVSANTITVTGNGQYTLSFDCSKDLSDAAVAAGVTDLNRLTAIYIKDYSVTTGKAGVSPLDSCDIMYDEIKVNGTPLTITQTEPKSALKDSGIFDTNDPFNSWDGSVVEEVKISNHVLTMPDIKKPTTVEVTFTLSNMKFTGMEPCPEYVPEAVQSETDTVQSETDTVSESDSSDAPVSTDSGYAAMIAAGAVAAAVIAVIVVIAVKRKKKA